MAKSKGPNVSGASDGDCCGTDCCGGESSCCGLPAAGCCEVEAVVSVDARGQMVLPKETRVRFGIKAGDKLAIAAWNKGGKPCCLTLLKVDELADAVRKAYGPMLSEIVGK